MPALRAISLIAVSSEQQAADERASLADQEARNLKLVNDLGATLIDTIRVPGFSRNYYTYHEFALAAAAEGKTDPMRLIDHWQRRDFDVLIVREGSRFGRKESIFAEVVLRTTDIGAYILLHSGERIDQTNRSMYIALGAYQAAGEISLIQKRKAVGMTKRFESGKTTSTNVPMSHRVVRNERGKYDHLELNPDTARLWIDLADVLLEGHGWPKTADLLYQRGHGRDGKPHDHVNLRRTIYSPIFWGHNVRNHRCRGNQSVGTWGFDESVSPPPPIEIIHHVHPAVYNGEQAELVKSELRRREQVWAGKARGAEIHALSGLLLCGHCGARLTYVSSRGCYRCSTNLRRALTRCPSSPAHITDAALRDQLNVMLTNMRKFADPLYLQSLSQPDGENIAQQITLIKDELARAETLAGEMLLQRAKTPISLQAILDAQITAIGDQVERLRSRLSELTTQELSAQSSNAQAHTAYAQLVDLDNAAFWALPPNTINQLLYALLGGKVLVIVDGLLVGTGTPARKSRTANLTHV